MIYLDYQSTTPCDERVLKKMLPYFCEKYANPHSNHSFGESIMDDINIARKEIADLIHAHPSEIIFTSGATEANNLAIKGLFNFYKNKNHIITSQIEHKCVLESLKYLERTFGAKITYIKPNNHGIIEPKDVEDAIQDDTLLVTIMTVNNEIGTIQPIRKIGEICKNHGVIFHTDAAQAFGKIPLNVIEDHVNLMSISGHKIYGPKGIGALFISKNLCKINKNPTRIRLTPLFSGGGQERNFRSGTLPTPLCIGLGEAAKIAKEEMHIDYEHAIKMRNMFLEILNSKLDKFYINGSLENRIPNNLNLSFEGVESESIIFDLEDIALTSVSACSSEKLESSYVLKSIGIDENLSHTSLRVGFGRFTTEDEVKYAAEKLANTVTKLRTISPFWGK